MGEEPALAEPIDGAPLATLVEPRRLAADDELLTAMVRATRQAFQALRSAGNTEIPRNLRDRGVFICTRTSVTSGRWPCGDSHPGSLFVNS
jgi:hypothetical protein